MMCSRVGNCLVSWAVLEGSRAYLLSDRDQELQSLGVNVSDLDTTLATKSASRMKSLQMGRTYWVKRIQSPSRAELIQT
jgi:hypothetical protein